MAKAKKKKTKKKAVKKQKFLKGLFKLNKKKLLIATACMLGFLIWLFWGVPLPSKLSTPPDVSTKLYDRNGQLIYEIFADKKRSPLSLDQIPDQVKHATIAIEDKDFYSHFGFSVVGMLRGAYKTVFKQQVEGGSTLTQQLVKNSLLTPERTIKRKLREFILSLYVDARYSKDTILEMYLNQIPYGSTAYGIEAASELYFNKKVAELDLAEATLLVGLPAAPTRYSPFGTHPEYAKQRQLDVLRRMVEDGYINQEEADNAAAEVLKYAEPENLKAPHFALWVKEQLAEKYGDAVVEKGGLRVTTTLDLDLQEKAQEIVANEVDKLSDRNVGNGAVLVTRPKSGEILAMVGSKDYYAEDEDGKVNIIFAERQPGSSIKPLNYALALKDKKITASTTLADIPTCFNVIGQDSYCPKNYDGEFHGAIQARFALANSYNVPAVRVLALNGLDNFVEFARSMGITTFKDPSNYGLSLTLGGGEVRPFDMAEAFGVFANEGVRVPLISILKVEDWKGKVLHEVDTSNREGARIIDPEVSFIISNILKDNGARAAAFGTSSQLRISGHPEVSVKTGTTNDLRDNWTIGYTGQVLVVSWVGNNDNTPMSGAVSGVSGASPIFNKTISAALEKSEQGAYNVSDQGHDEHSQPSDVIGTNICSSTGASPGGVTQGCPTRFEYFLNDTIPDPVISSRGVYVDRIRQTLADEQSKQEDIETQDHLVIFDPLGTQICLDCPFPMPQATIQYPISQ